MYTSRLSILFFILYGVLFAQIKSTSAPTLSKEALLVERVQNNYVAVDVDYTLRYGSWEQGGDPTGSANFRKITYGWNNATPQVLGTEWIMFYVDGNWRKTPPGQSWYWPSPYLPSPDSAYRQTAQNKICVVWNNWNGVYIKVCRKPVSLGSIPGIAEQIEHRITMKSVDGVTHQCGAMIFFDIMIGDNDSARIATSYGYSATSQLYTAPDIPSVWRAYEGGYPPAPADLSALGILVGFDAITPDYFWFGNWYQGRDKGWDIAQWAAIVGSPTDDASAMVRWNTRTVPHGTSVEFVTYYGIGNFAPMEVTLEHSPPTIYPDCDGTFQPDTAGFDAMITNGGLGNICDIEIELVGPAGFRVHDPNPITMATLGGYGGTYLAHWDVTFDSTIWNTDQTYIIQVSFDDCMGNDSSVAETVQVHIPHPSNIQISLSADRTALCIGDSTRLHGSFSGHFGTAEYFWTDFMISDPHSLNPWVYPNISADYSLYVMDENGCTEHQTIRILVSNMTVMAGNDAQVCRGDTVQLGWDPSVVNGIPPYTYNWTPASGLDNPSSPRPMASPNSTTTYVLQVTDSIGCIAYDTLIVEVLTPPHGRITTPDPCGLITSCQNQVIQAILAGDGSTPVSTSSIKLWLDGVLYTWPTGMTYTDSTFTFTPTSPFLHNDTVSVVIYYEDTRGCAGDTLRCSFVVDTRPPVANMVSPAPFSSTFETSPAITVTVTDVPAGVRTVTPTVTFNGSHVTGYTQNWTPPNLTLSGFDFSAGGIVQVCVNVLDDPDYSYCPPNDSVYCWQFTVVTGEVTAYPVEPLPGQITACANQNIIIHIEGTNPVDTNSIYFRVNGIAYNITSPQLSYNPSTQELVFTPSLSWNDGDTIHYVVWATDIYGGEIDDTMRASFIVDLSPPVISNIIPPPSTSVDSLIPSFRFDIFDSIAGLESLRVRVDDTIVLRPGIPCVTWTGTTFTWNANCAGVSFNPGYVVEVCVYAWDSPDLCTPNALDSCWTFTVSTLCSLWANAGHDTSVCINDTLMLGGTPPAGDGTPLYNYEWRDPSGALISTDANPIIPVSISGWYKLRVVDALGCVALDSVYIDAYPCGGVGATLIHPANDSWSSCDPESIVISIIGPGEIQPSTITLSVNDIIYTISSPEIRWNAPYLVFMPAGGWPANIDVNVALISASDEYGNTLEGAPVTWNFHIDRTAPQLVSVTPNPYTILYYPQDLTMVISEIGSGLDPASVRLYVNEAEFAIDTVCLDIPDTTGTVDLVLHASCFNFGPCETILVRLYATDRIDICNDNVLDTTWRYTSDCVGPEVSIVSPCSSMISSCAGESIMVRIQDILPGVDTTSITIIVDGASYHSEVHGTGPTLRYNTLTGTAVWHPMPPLPDTGSITAQAFASDRLGNLSDTAVWTFVMDRWQPSVVQITPECGETLFSVILQPRIYAIDRPAGIDADSVILTVNGVPYTDGDIVSLGDTIFYLAPSSSIILPGGSIAEICWHLVDNASDICPPNVVDTCCSIYVASGGPSAIIRNPADGSFVSCSTLAIYGFIFDSDGLLPESVRVGIEVNGVPQTLTLTSPGITYNFYGDSIVFVWTPSSIANGDEISVVVNSTRDSLLNPIGGSIGVRFTIDYLPPVLVSSNCAHGTVFETTTPTFCVTLSDFGAGVDPNCNEFEINTQVFDISVSGVTYNPVTGEFCVDCEAAGLTFTGGDTIDICVRSCDEIDTCEPNTLDSCWQVFIASGGPDIIAQHPGDGVITACFPDSVVFLIYDPSGMNSTDITVDWINIISDDTTHLNVGSGLSITPLSLCSLLVVAQFITFTMDGDSIRACVTEAYDVLGNPISAPFCIDFVFDNTTPSVQFLTPAPGDTVYTPAPTVRALISDGGGVDTMSVLVIVGNDTFSISDPCVDITGDTMIFTPLLCEFEWSGGDSAVAQFVISDIADSCGPNTTSVVDWFIIAREAPVVSITRPFQNAISACEHDSVVFAITTIAGIETMSIRVTWNSNEYQLPNPNYLHFDYATGTLIFAPPTGFPEGNHIVCLTHITDTIGNDISAPVCVNFTSDYSPPDIQIVFPPADIMIHQSESRITVDVRDWVGRIDTSALEFIVSGSPIPHNNLTWSSITSGWRVEYRPLQPFTAGESVYVEIITYDWTDYCTPHSDTTRWAFYIEPVVGCEARPKPFTPNFDGINDKVILHYPGMFTKTAKLYVYNVYNHLVCEKTLGPVSAFDECETKSSWSGEDTNGAPLPPGLYLYIIIAEDGGVLCSGSVVIAR